MKLYKNILDKVQNRLETIFRNIVEGSKLTKRQVEWCMAKWIMFTVLFFQLVFVLLLVNSIFMSGVLLWTLMTFFFLLTYIIYKFWCYSVNTILRILYDDSHTDENGDASNLFGVLNSALKQLESLQSE